jgi:hypothetical protein
MAAGFYKRGCQEKTLFPSLASKTFSDIQPPPATARLRAGAWFSLGPSVPGPSPWCRSGRLLRACKQRGGNCQRWFYLRLVAYCFVGKKSGSHGAPYAPSDNPQSPLIAKCAMSGAPGIPRVGVGQVRGEIPVEVIIMARPRGPSGNLVELVGRGRACPGVGGKKARRSDLLRLPNGS